MTPNAHANEILTEATLRKIKLIPDGTLLIARCAGKLPMDMERKLVENKPAILKLLEAKQNLARQVLDGEFSPLDGRMFGLICSELVIQYHDPLCRRAFEHLRVCAAIKQTRNPR
ncbi:MAG TPA: hypothetical protein VH251_01115 [Verrucomicrobiae bacterium]|jgi:hypothetical protein|nr:hypothetical protein [Verrucomicrobiae bacterium]